VNVEEAETHLRDYLLDGIAAEIFWADEAYALAEEIGKHVQQINDANFGALFSSLQVIFSDRQTLSITKVFDPATNPRYPTRSVPATLAFLEDHAELWKVPQRHRLHQILTEAGVDSAHVEQLRSAELTRAIVAHYKGALANLSLPLATLRQSRNKVIAHNEAIKRSTLQQPTWGEAISLVNYAKEFVATIGFAYLSTIFGTNSSDYYLTLDARRTARHLRRLLEAANIVAST
jgi:AbiU2